MWEVTLLDPTYDNVKGAMNCATTNASPPKIDAYGAVMKLHHRYQFGDSYLSELLVV